MNAREQNRIKRAIREIANREGIREEEVRTEMQKAIDAAMQSTDPKARARFQSVFGDARPDPEMFISLICRYLEGE